MHLIDGGHISRPASPPKSSAPPPSPPPPKRVQDAPVRSSGASPDAIERSQQAAKKPLVDAATNTQQKVTQAAHANQSLASFDHLPPAQRKQLRGEIETARAEANRANREAKQAIAEELDVARQTLSPAHYEDYVAALEREFEGNVDEQEVVRKALKTDVTSVGEKPGDTSLTAIRDKANELKEAESRYAQVVGHAANLPTRTRYLQIASAKADLDQKRAELQLLVQADLTKAAQEAPQSDYQAAINRRAEDISSLDPSNAALRAIAATAKGQVIQTAKPAEVAIDEALGEIDSGDTPYQQVDAVESHAKDLRAQYGDAVAEEFVSRYIVQHPDTFAEGYVGKEALHDINDDTRALFANGLDRAYSSIQPSQYYGPASFTHLLAQGGLRGYQSLPDGSLIPSNGGLSALIGQTGNSALQTHYVDSALSATKVWTDAWKEPDLQGDNSDTYRELSMSYEFLGTIGLATTGSADAAEKVIEFAESNSIGTASKGVESLRAILYTFNTARVVEPNSYLTFLETAVPPDTPYYHAGVTAPTTPLSDQHSLTLFLAISGASTDGEGLLEVDGPGGKDDPAATALTAKLFENYFERWVTNDDLGFVIGGNIAEKHTEAIQNFFKEALLDPNEAGSYRDELLTFVVDNVFGAFDPNSPIAKAIGQNKAGVLAGNLLGILDVSQKELRETLENASTGHQRLFALLTVVAVAAAGAYLGPIGGAAATALMKGVSAAMVELAKSGGRLTVEELTTRLTQQGIDKDVAELVAGVIDSGKSVAEYLQDPAVVEKFEEIGISSEQLELAAATILDASGDTDTTLGQAIEDGIKTLEDDSTLSDEEYEDIRRVIDQINDGIDRQRN